MEPGTITIKIRDRKIFMDQMFSYIKKKTEDNKEAIMICCRDISKIREIQACNESIAIIGKTLGNHKYPNGLSFACASCIIDRADKRIGYSEFLFVCQEMLIEE